MGKHRTSISSNASLENEENTIEEKATKKRKLPKQVEQVEYQNLVEKFTAENPSLKRISSNDLDFDQYEQICTLQIPKSIDPQLLLSQTINLDRKTKLKLNNERFVITLCPEAESRKLLILGDKFQLIKPFSELVLQRSLKTKKGKAMAIPETKPVSFPDNLKERHPLFGADFEDKVELNDEIRSRLNSPIKKKKKKRKTEKDERADDYNQEVVLQLLENHTKSKVKKKKKHDIEAQEESNFSPVKQLKEKQNGELGKTKKSKKKRKLSEAIEEQVVKTPKSGKGRDSLIESIVSTNEDEILLSPRKKKLKKIDKEPKIQENGWKTDESEPVTTISKKSKEKLSISLPVISNEDVSVHKKKVKNKEKDDKPALGDSLISDILNSAKKELKKKCKRRHSEQFL